MNLLYIPYPSWLKPEIFPGLPGIFGVIRWYSLMYIVAFAVAYYLYRRQIRERNFPMSEDNLYSMFCAGILGLLLGARLFYALVYSQGFYLKKPWLIFWPFYNGEYTGIQGLSYHGGAIGCLLAIIIYTKVRKLNFREIGDMFAAAIPLGYTFGRLGNFTNAELYGRVTTSPIGMVFPNTDGLARHPSQLYEMIFEGIVLWAIIWFFRNRKPFKGFLTGLYFLGYGFFRFFIEYFREPDSHMPNDGFPLLNFTTGQILCFIMMVFGVIWILACSRLPDKEAIRIYEDQDSSKSDKEARSERNKERNKRKKMR